MGLWRSPLVFFRGLAPFFSGETGRLGLLCQAVTEILLSHTLAGLFLISFLAATLLPLSSEAALSLALALGESPRHAFWIASTGNCLACLVNYGTGLLLRGVLLRKLAKKRSGRVAYRLIRKYGPISLFLSWAPVLGDPITLLAGIFRINFWLFVGLVFSLRMGRYALIIALTIDGG